MKKRLNLVKSGKWKLIFVVMFQIVRPLVLLLSLLTAAGVYGQIPDPILPETTGPFVRFYAAKDQKYGFDDYRFEEWKEEYSLDEQLDVDGYRIPVKSLAYGQTDEVCFELKNPSGISLDSVHFITSSGQRLNWYRSPVGLKIHLHASDSSYSVEAIAGKRKLGTLRVEVFKTKKFRIVLVPLVQEHISADSLTTALNTIFVPSMIRFSVLKMNPFYHKDIDTTELMENPSMDYERYTAQMQHIRNLWLEAHPGFPKERLVIFITPSFTDQFIKGFMVRGKSVGFVVEQPKESFTIVLARNLARSIGGLTDSWRNDGPSKYSTDNLMDRASGVSLRASQWKQLQNTVPTFSIFDNYENVRSNNGMVAYYFWRQQPDGTIFIENNNLLRAVRRPYKKNYFSYHLNIDNFFFRGLFFVRSYRISLLHLFIAATILSLSVFFRRKIKRFIISRIRMPRVLRFLGFLLHVGATAILIVILFRVLDASYYFFEVSNGQINAYRHLSLSQAIDVTSLNENPKRPNESLPGSEILMKSGQSWTLKRAEQVLYFVVQEDSLEQYTALRFSHSSDSLVVKTQNFRSKVASHYLVFQIVDSAGKLQTERIFNHYGSEITGALKLPDPVRRILIFVNGYRPTSIGATFEDKFRDIENRGLEFPDSRNIVYDFDRYDYWNPWNQMDEKFRKRINPANVYYADGHFSVRTSNYRSLLNFTTVSTIYPKRCADPNHHVCWTNPSIRPSLLATQRVNTIDLLKARPNQSGFNQRRINGRIAGKNILQMLNDIPNRSENDTLYIVAHSMGFAYALGIVDELRGEINFGTFYILAPENAISGKVNPSEWREIWQYGSKFTATNYDPPCLQDGVAPQFSVAGLPQSHRIFFPRSLFEKRGFFDTHFIGYYDWLFDIQGGKPGYIRQL